MGQDLLDVSSLEQVVPMMQGRRLVARDPEFEQRHWKLAGLQLIALAAFTRQSSAQRGSAATRVGRSVDRGVEEVVVFVWAKAPPRRRARGANEARIVNVVSLAKWTVFGYVRRRMESFGGEFFNQEDEDVETERLEICMPTVNIGQGEWKKGKNERKRRDVEKRRK